MSVHINAKPGEIAETVLMPGDPLRARWIAETFFDDYKEVNNTRGMYGYTGFYKGKRVSVQGSGMGMPSAMIYLHELIRDYGAKNLIRVGSAGAYQADIQLRDIIIAMSASTDAAFNRERFNGSSYAPTASGDLFLKAVEVARQKNISVRVGNVLSSDMFYRDDPEDYKKWAQFGVLCAEMETAALYTVAAQYQVNALSVLTISDSLVTGEECSSEDRQTSFNQMIEIALGLI